MKDIHAEYPVQLAEYAQHRGIEDQPAFAWWVPHVIKKRNRIISRTKSKYWTRTHKFGIRIPKNVEEAKYIDDRNNNTLWWDAICKEMRNVRIAFEEYDEKIDDLVGYKEFGLHLIFDVKMGENFRRKARLVAEGHKTSTPASITYSSVVSRDSVRIALTVAALNGCISFHICIMFVFIFIFIFLFMFLFFYFHVFYCVVCYDYIFICLF